MKGGKKSIAQTILYKSFDIIEKSIKDKDPLDVFDQAIKNLNILITEGINLRYFTEELINYLRKIILVKISGASEKYFFDIEKEVEKKIIAQAKKFLIWKFGMEF